MPLGSGFGTGPFGVDPFGQTNFARKILLENIPSAYLDEDSKNDYLLTKFIRSLYPHKNEFRTYLDRFPLIRDPENLPKDDIAFYGIVENENPIIQVTMHALPFVIPGDLITVIGDNPAETITVAVTEVLNRTSRIRIGSPWPFATSIREATIHGVSYRFLVANGSDLFVPVPDTIPDIKVGDHIQIGEGRHVVARVDGTLFNVEIYPTPVVASVSVPLGSLINDGETFTISDGIHPAITFEFDKNNAVIAGNVAVTINNTFTIEEVRDAMVMAINDAVNFGVMASPQEDTVFLACDTSGVLTISDTVATPDFAVDLIARPQLTRVSRLSLLTLLAKDIGFADNAAQLEEVRRGLVLHAVDFYKRKGTAKGYYIRGATEGIKVDVANVNQIPCLDGEFLTVCEGSITAIVAGAIPPGPPGPGIWDGETFTITDAVNPPVVFEFDTDGVVTPGRVGVVINPGDAASVVATAIEAAINGVVGFRVHATVSGNSVSLKNPQDGLAGEIPITETVTDPGFVVTGMTSLQEVIWNTPVAEGSIETWFIVNDGSTVTISDISGPKIFEFDDNGVWNPTHIRVDVTFATAEQIAQALADAINAVPFFHVKATVDPVVSPVTSLRTIIRLRNEVDGFNSAIPMTETVAFPAFKVSGMFIVPEEEWKEPTQTTDPIIYLASIDSAPIDIVALDSPSYFKYFDYGTRAYGYINAIAGNLLNDGETFTIADGEFLNPIDVTMTAGSNQGTTLQDPAGILPGDYVFIDAVVNIISGIPAYVTRLVSKTFAFGKYVLTFENVFPFPPFASGVYTAKWTRPVTFEFDTDAIVAPGNIAVPIDNTMTADQVATAIENAIKGLGIDLRITPVNLFTGGLMQIFQQTPGTASRCLPMKETVVNPLFGVLGLTDGKIGDLSAFPVRFDDLNQNFVSVGIQVGYNSGPGPNQITTTTQAWLIVGDVVDFGTQQRIVTASPGTGLLAPGAIITFDQPLIGVLLTGGTCTRITRQPDLSPFGDFLTIGATDYKVVQYNTSTFAGRTDLVIPNSLVGVTVIAARTRTRAVSREQAYGFCRLPILDPSGVVDTDSIFFTGENGLTQLIKDLDEVRPLHVRFRDVSFEISGSVSVPIPIVTVVP
jgi:hypothetical protein